MRQEDSSVKQVVDKTPDKTWRLVGSVMVVVVIAVYTYRDLTHKVGDMSDMLKEQSQINSNLELAVRELILANALQSQTIYNLNQRVDEIKKSQILQGQELTDHFRTHK